MKKIFGGKLAAVLGWILLGMLCGDSLNSASGIDPPLPLCARDEDALGVTEFLVGLAPLESRACTFLWGRSKKIRLGRRSYIQGVCLQPPGNGGIQLRSSCPRPDGRSSLV